MEQKTNLVVFFDTVGRTIVGERSVEDSNDQVLAVKNPAVIHIQPNQQTGQLTLQILPLFFKEFLADKNAATVWLYHKNMITEAKDMVFDFKLQAQYQQIFGGTPAPKQPQSEPEVIRLFDDE